MSSPLEPHASTPVEMQARLAAERAGEPFLVFRDAEGAQRIVVLAGAQRFTLGRGASCDLPLVWDSQVSRLHAEIERVADEWVIVDDGLSSNGTFAAGARVDGRRRLRDGDVLRLGETALVFRQPARDGALTTRMSDQREIAATVTDAQRRVLVELCRPCKGYATEVSPATNAEIAAALYLTVAAVKTHLRAMTRSFGIDDLPQHDKRRRLVALAFASGVVSDRDL